MISPDLLPLLACPCCKGPLVEKDDALVCSACPRSYPIVNGIPDLVP
jgi:uncharacterized protein YbaR (Trm112 family)